MPSATTNIGACAKRLSSFWSRSPGSVAAPQRNPAGKRTGRAIIVCAGGGYGTLDWRTHVGYAAPVFNAQGVAGLQDTPRAEESDLRQQKASLDDQVGQQERLQAVMALKVDAANAALARALGDIPVGVVTAVVGAPFFLYLLRRAQTGYEL